MPTNYILNWSDSTLKTPFTLVGGTVNTASTPITLTGKGAHNWGEPLQENLLRITENFASLGQQPNSPTVGMLWFDAAGGALYLRTVSNTWVQLYPHPVAGPPSPTPAPTPAPTPTPTPAPTTPTFTVDMDYIYDFDNPATQVWGSRLGSTVNNNNLFKMRIRLTKTNNVPWTLQSVDGGYIYGANGTDGFFILIGPGLFTGQYTIADPGGTFMNGAIMQGGALNVYNGTNFGCYGNWNMYDSGEQIYLVWQLRATNLTGVPQVGYTRLTLNKITGSPSISLPTTQLEIAVPINP